MRSAASDLTSRKTTIRENFAGSAGGDAGSLVAGAAAEVAAAAAAAAAEGVAVPSGAAFCNPSASGAACPAASCTPLVSSTVIRRASAQQLLPAFMAASWGGCGGCGWGAHVRALPPATCSGAAAPAALVTRSRLLSGSDRQKGGQMRVRLLYSPG